MWQTVSPGQDFGNANLGIAQFNEFFGAVRGQEDDSYFLGCSVLASSSAQPDFTARALTHLNHRISDLEHAVFYGRDIYKRDLFL